MEIQMSEGEGEGKAREIVRARLRNIVVVIFIHGMAGVFVIC